MYAHADRCVEAIGRYPPLLLSAFFTWDRSFPGLRHLASVRLAGQWAPGILYLPPSNAGIAGTHCHVQSLREGWRPGLRSLCLFSRHSSKLGHLPPTSPTFYLGSLGEQDYCTGSLYITPKAKLHTLHSHWVSGLYQKPQQETDLNHPDFFLLF